MNFSKLLFSILAGCVAPFSVVAQTAQTAQTVNYASFDSLKTLMPERADASSVHTRVYMHHFFKNSPPRLAYASKPSSLSFDMWKQRVSDKVLDLMNWPDLQVDNARRVNSSQRDGYKVERWEFMPAQGMCVPFLVLVPDKASRRNPVPAILCIPGWGQTKESLASEPSVAGGEFVQREMAMARAYAREGWIAVCADTPGSGETGEFDVIKVGGPDYRTLARQALELGSSYLSLYSYINKGLLEWMKTRPEMCRDRLVISGFSFGTEPLMALGVTDPEVYAFVYNDFLCNNRERALTMTCPDEKGRRPWPNDIEHLIPGFLLQFDFPDLVTALAPRPVLCTEGGLDRDFEMVARGFAESGSRDNFEWHHYPKFSKPEDRSVIDSVPAGVTLSEYFRLVNVDPPHHGFKRDLILPWLHKILDK